MAGTKFKKKKIDSYKPTFVLTGIVLTGVYSIWHMYAGCCFTTNKQDRVNMEVMKRVNMEVMKRVKIGVMKRVKRDVTKRVSMEVTNTH